MMTSLEKLLTGYFVEKRPTLDDIYKRGFNFPAHRNLRVSEGVENLLR